MAPQGPSRSDWAIPLFVLSFGDMFIFEFVLIFHFLFWQLVWWISIFWVPLFRAWILYRFFIDLGMDFFYHSEKHDFWWFSWSFSLQVSALIFGEFGYQFQLHFGSLLVLISCVCFAIVFLWIFDYILNGNLTTMYPKDNGPVPPFCSLFRDLFPHTSTFYLSKTYKCQKPRFPIYFYILKIKRMYPQLYLLQK